MKRFTAIISVFLLLAFFSPAAFATNITLDSGPLSFNEEVMPYTEQTEWVFRINNGNWEKRLWSYTYGKWLTDWIYVGPAT